MIIVKIEHHQGKETLGYEVAVANKDTARVLKEMALAYFKQNKIQSYSIQANDGEGNTVPVGVITLDF